MSSGWSTTQREAAHAATGVTADSLVRSIRAARHDAERRSLLRKSAAARARQTDGPGESLQPEPLLEASAEPEPTADAAPPRVGPSWRVSAARQAYLSTLPPPACDAPALVRVSHKA